MLESSNSKQGNIQTQIQASNNVEHATPKKNESLKLLIDLTSCNQTQVNVHDVMHAVYFVTSLCSLIKIDFLFYEGSLDVRFIGCCHTSLCRN